MSIKIVLNGAGRIGKSILKQLLNDENFEIVAFIFFSTKSAFFAEFLYRLN